MLTILLVSQIVSWLMIFGLVLGMLALTRQLGVLHTRVAPAGALTLDTSPTVGDAAPVLDLTTLGGDRIMIGGPHGVGRTRLLMFVSPLCPICKQLIPVAKSFAAAERLDVIFAGDDDSVDLRRMIALHRIESLPFINSAELGRRFRVDRLPHAVLLTTDGIVAAKGLVNSREHLESLVASHEMGVASIQDYLEKRPSLGSEAALRRMNGSP